MLELEVSRSRIGADASDEHGNQYELKTTTTGSVGTGRDVGFSYFGRMRTRYLIAARGRQTHYSFAFEEIYFLHPDDLEEWIRPIEARLERDSELIEAAVSSLLATGAAPENVERLRYLGSRGLTLNNPKIPWAYISRHGTLLGQHPELDLRTLVEAHPILVSPDDEAEEAPRPDMPPTSGEE